MQGTKYTYNMLQALACNRGADDWVTDSCQPHTQPLPSLHSPSHRLTRLSSQTTRMERHMNILVLVLILFAFLLIASCPTPSSLSPRSRKWSGT